MHGADAAHTGNSEVQHSITIHGTAQGGIIEIGLTGHPTMPPVTITTQPGQTAEQIVILLAQAGPQWGILALTSVPENPNALTSRTQPGGMYMHSTDPGIPNRPGISNLQATIAGTSIQLTWQNPNPAPDYLYITTGHGGIDLHKGTMNDFTDDGRHAHDTFYRTIQYSVVCLYLDGAKYDETNDNPTFSVSDVVKSQVLNNPRFKKMTAK
jgi:hypothetical protein